MVDNGVFSAQKTANNSSIPQPASDPSLVQPSIQPGISATPQQSTSQAIQGQPVATNPDAARLTLEDLYGPSIGAQQPATSPQIPIPQSISTPLQASDGTMNVSDSPVPSPSAQTPSLNELASLQEKATTEISLVSSPNSAQPLPPHDTRDEGGGSFKGLLMKVLGGLLVSAIVLFIISGISSLYKGASTNKDVTLTYWGLWEDSNVFQGIINDFHRANPHITINYLKQDPDKYTDRLLTRMQNGTGPDIFRFHNSWTVPLRNALLPLPSSVIDPNQLKQNYFAVVANDLVSNGAVYGIPLGMDVLVMYTNKDIFDHAGVKVPTSWDDFVTVAKGLTVKDSDGHIKTAGTAMGTYENITHAPDIMSLLLLQNGTNLQKLQDSQNALDALTFYTSFAKNDDRVWDSTLDTSLSAFEGGKIAMYFGYSYDYFAIKAAAPQLNFEIHPVPHLPGRDMSIASYWVEGVSSKSKHPKEAFLFMKYLAQKDVMAKLYTEEAKTRQFGEIYPRTDLASILSSDPILAPFVNQAGKAVSSFFVSDTKFDTFNGSLNRYLGNAINSMLNDTSADSALSTLVQGVSQVFNQYGTSSQ